MVFKIKNETGHTITLMGSSYSSGSYVPIVDCIGFGGIKWTRNDVDGANAGRGLDGKMIRDRVATKSKWEVSLLGAIKSNEAQSILNLIYPETFHIKTDYPTGTETEYLVYSNNVPVTFALKRGNDEYYSGISFPLVEV